jgi:molybdate transport system permease protein
MFDAAMFETILLTLQLAAVTTIVLLIIGIPLAWWLARSKMRAKEIVAVLVSLPIVLPPTVLGFYLLIAMGPNSPLTELIGRSLPFTFEGLVVGSTIYSLPFVVNPIRNAFETMSQRHWEAAATLRARPLDAFLNVALPLALPGILTGAILGFAHTMGEFGVVLMIGGNIPGQTRVLSVAVFEHVEAVEFASAHRLAAGMVAFALVVLVMLYWVNRPRRDEPSQPR